MSEPRFNHAASTSTGTQMPARLTGGNGGDGRRHTRRESSNKLTPRESDARPNQSQFNRRQSIAARQISLTQAKPEAMGPPAAPASLRNRRQSHFTSSISTNSLGRAPRKSVGPGILSSSTSEFNLARAEGNPDSHPERLQSLRSQKSIESTGIGTNLRVRSRPPGTPGRDLKAKSMVSSQDFLAANMPTPDIPWTSRSPNRAGEKGPGTPSSARRMSVMPGHATGLGARTVSPTDARRMKRLSMMPDAPPMPLTPSAALPDPPFITPRSAAQSPSFIPRKSVTPTSSRTTPDPKRKSYNSVVSNSSSTSFNSFRGPPVSRTQTSSSLSRLPMLKGRSETSSTNATEEGVPPVPAIPKAYESPINEHDIPFFTNQKSSLAMDSRSIESPSTSEHPSASSLEKEVEHLEQEVKQFRNRPRDDSQATVTAKPSQNSKKNSQPLRLPPLNVLPLSTPTAAKVMSLQEHSDDSASGYATPPLKRGNMKTPSTPMTASKASFYSHKDSAEGTFPIPIPARSISSHYALRQDLASYRPPSSSSASIRANHEGEMGRKAVSPFVSSSLPKTSSEDFSSLKSKTTTDRSTSNTGSTARQSRLTGPRPLLSSKASYGDAMSEPASPAEQEHHSFGSTLRRKLSLTRKRSTEMAAHKDADDAPEPPKHEMMPPPRLPASGAWAGPISS